MRFLLFLTLAIALSSHTSHSLAQSEGRAIGGRLIKSETRQPDGSKIIRYPDGKVERYGADGRRLKGGRTCTNGRTGGNIITCYDW